jgi:hypothetical protein
LASKVDGSEVVGSSRPRGSSRLATIEAALAADARRVLPNIDMVSRGERVEITRRKKWVAMIVPPERSEVLLDRRS